MFGMGFTEILLIAVVAILFLGPDKLPDAMVQIAKFFRSAKKTLAAAKDTLDEEMNMSELKEEALNYQKQLTSAHSKLDDITSGKIIKDELNSVTDGLMDDVTFDEPDEVTFTKEKKKKKKKIAKDSSENTKNEDSVDV